MGRKRQHHTEAERKAAHKIRHMRWYNKNKEVLAKKAADDRKLNPAKYKERQKKDEENNLKNIRKYLLKGVRVRAKSLNKDFDLSLEDMPDLPDVCPISGLKLECNIGKGGPQRNSYSVDRVDNSKGYIKGNIGIISRYANHLKSNFSVEEIDNLYRYIHADHSVRLGDQS